MGDNYHNNGCDDDLKQRQKYTKMWINSQNKPVFNQITDFSEEEEISNECQLIISNVRSLKTDSDCGQPMDNNNQIECIDITSDNSDIGSDEETTETNVNDFIEAVYGKPDTEFVNPSLHSHITPTPIAKAVPKTLANNKNSVHKVKDINNCVFRCLLDDCNLLFRTFELLKQHQFDAHKKKNPFKEGVHSPEPTIGNTIDERPQTSGEKFVCDYIGCGKLLKSEFTLKIHQERHSGVSYKCRWKGCSAVFKLKQSFNSHMIKHKRIFPCDWDNCQYSATSAANLTIHKRKHYKGKKLFCPLCGKRFSDVEFLRAHQKYYHKMKDFSKK